PFTQAGSIAPAEARDFAVQQALPFLSENGLYPVQVRLLSKEEPVATLRTPMVFLSDVPQTPLHLAWTWVLARPMQTGPDGVFEPGTLESDIAPGGPVDAAVSAMDSA